MLDAALNGLLTFAQLEMISLTATSAVLLGIPLTYSALQLASALFEPLPLPSRKAVVARELTLISQEQRSN
jgi:hypothetical protein